MRAGILFALFAIAALLLQTTLLPLAAIGRATPDLLLIMCVYLGLHQHTVGGAIGAFFLGYLEDTFSGSVLGLNAFGMCLVFTIVYLTSRRLWVDNAISKVVVVFLASVLKTLAILALVAAFMSVEGLSNSVLRYLVVEAMLAAILSPAIFAVLAHTAELSTAEKSSVVPLTQREVPVVLRRRLAVAVGIALLSFLLLLARLWNLQILHGDDMRTLSENNRIRLHRVQATRGTVVDRYGRVLIDSRPSFDAVLVPEDARNVEATIENLAQLLNQSAADMHALLTQTSTRPPFEEIAVKRDLSWDDVVALETHQLDLPGVNLQITPRRSYPLGTKLAHLLGYVGEANQEDLAADSRYRMGDSVGKVGLEKRWESALRGVNGGQQVEVDAVGRKLRVLREVDEIPGATIKLTIDLDLQDAAAAALGDRDGSIVALDPNTGEILAFVDNPSFDPNIFARGVRTQEWRGLLADKHRPLNNRAIQGQYPPGSTFKIIVATAALEEGVINPFTRIHCPGGLQFGNHYFRCWKKGGHGTVNLHEALVQSCDVFFYQIAQRLGIDVIAQYARAFGLGMPTGIDLEHEKAGTIPDSAWKRKRFKQPWYAGETLSAGIGQGYVTATPLQMANAIATAAVGKRYRPHFVRQVETPEGEVVHAEQPEVTGELNVRATTLREVRDGLRDVVNTERGTGKKARISGIEVAGKTGTSQVVKMGKERLKSAQIPWQHRDHAWFVAYAPVDAPEIAVAAIVEHADGGGGAVAAPIVREVIQKFVQLKKARESTKYAENRSPAAGAF